MAKMQNSTNMQNRANRADPPLLCKNLALCLCFRYVFLIFNNFVKVRVVDRDFAILAHSQRATITKSKKNRACDRIQALF